MRPILFGTFSARPRDFSVWQEFPFVGAGFRGFGMVSAV
jgi:hypothetical protein